MTWRPLPDPEGSLPVRVGDHLSSVLRRLGGGDARATSLIFGSWTSIVGPSIAAHASPEALRGSTLVVGVDAPAYATQLRLMTPQLIARLTEMAGPGAIDNVEVRVRA